ncbi:MAG TPA: transglycosylase SLT domain-containing protein [Sphingobacteriaceae bacterium]
MMRKAMATALFILVTAVVGAAPNKNKENPVQGTTFGIRVENENLSVEDTVLLPVYSSNPALSYQNLVYKRRLDSIQRSVELSYNEHVQHYIDIYVSRKEQIGKMLGLSDYYFPIFEKSLKEIGIPDEIKYISIIESALNPQAVSKSGAMGPWQFMFATAKGYGLLIDSYVDERKDPVAASYAAARYFRDAYKDFGDWLLAIAAYNCGSGNVRKAIARSGGETDFWKIRPFLPLETRNYVPAFIATIYVMNYYAKHDITSRPADFSIQTDSIAVNKFVSLSKISEAIDVDVNELSILNPSYKKKIINGTPDKPKRLVVPKIERPVFASLYNALNNVPESEVKFITASNANYKSVQINRPAAHRVKAGETLQSIGNYYGVEVQDLKVWNNLKSMVIVPGQILKLASKQKISDFTTYEVKKGDTLNDIAEKFRRSASQLIEINGLKDTNLQPGMLIKINKA